MCVLSKDFWDGPLPEPRKENKHSKGYPEIRDPAADKPRGILNATLDEASLRRLRQHYGPRL